MQIIAWEVAPFSVIDAQADNYHDAYNKPGTSNISQYLLYPSSIVYFVTHNTIASPFVASSELYSEPKNIAALSNYVIVSPGTSAE